MQASGTWLHVCQMLPIIVLVLTSLFSSVLFSPFFPSQPYALERTRYTPQEDEASQLTYGPDKSACIIILAAFVGDICRGYQLHTMHFSQYQTSSESATRYLCTVA